MNLLEFIKVLEGLDGPKDRIHVFAEEVHLDNTDSITGDIMSCKLTLVFPKLYISQARELYNLVAKSGAYAMDMTNSLDGRRVERIKSLGDDHGS